MTSEAQFEETPAGLVRSGPGWFTVNIRDAAWFRNENYGSACQLEEKHPFEQVGANVRVLRIRRPSRDFC